LADGERELLGDLVRPGARGCSAARSSGRAGVFHAKPRRATRPVRAARAAT